jgi:hypothetical protein
MFLFLAFRIFGLPNLRIKTNIKQRKLLTINNLNKYNMKKTFRLPFLIIAVFLSLVACKGNQSGNSTDSAKVDSSTSIKSSTDTIKKVDTTKPATDTSKIKTDTVSKVVKKTTEVKKVKVKKE